MITHKENKVALDLVSLYNIVIGGIMGFMFWDKKQDKRKLKEHEDKLSDLKVTVARQDERHKALVADVSEIKDDTKEIKRMLMEKMHG